MSESLTFVLVHGTSCGGWVWREVAALLRKRGHNVYTPTLTGLGDRSHLCAGTVDFDLHVTDIASALEYEDLSGVVLVGHSYGGLVITGVAAHAPERLARLVYVDAYVPVAGERAIDLWPPEERRQAEADIAAGRTTRATPPLRLLGVTDPAQQAWIEKRLTPQPYHTYDEPVPAGTAATAALPRAFILCTQGPSPARFGPSAERVREGGGIVRSLDAPHFTMFTDPAETADLIVAVST